MTERALVVGAGISGLAAARALVRRGLDVTMLEAAPRAGGCLLSRREDGFTVELGPNTVLASPELEALCADAGCADRLVPAAPAASRRYVVADGRAVALPAGPGGFLSTPILSWRGKLRLLSEPFRRRGPGAMETVDGFFRRRLGAEAAERLGDAMVLGIYAGDPAEIAVGYAFPTLYELEEEAGSLLRGGLRRARQRRAQRKKRPGTPRGRRPVSFTGGMAHLAERLSDGLDLRLDRPATALQRTEAGFRVTAGGETFEAEKLVLAVPEEAAWRLLRPLLDGPGPEPLPRAAVAVVALGYRRSQVAHPLDGFGLLVPHREGRRLLGCLFTSTLFPDRAPDGHVLLTAMVGGRRRPELAALDETQLVELVREELAELLGVQGEPVLTTVHRWADAIPQPTPRWIAGRDVMDALEHRHPGLWVLGNWLRGVGIPDCVKAGWELAP